MARTGISPDKRNRMARIKEIPEGQRRGIVALKCPTFETTPFVEGPPLTERRVAIISTAGLHRRGDRPFRAGSADYRIIPGDRPPDDIVMSHISSGFDRTGYQSDSNIVFPLERLREMAEAGEIGSVAGFHYSFMGATDPDFREDAESALARLLAGDHVDAALLVPV
jgi:D-proline reductase (dithiol) PrdB